MQVIDTLEQHNTLSTLLLSLLLLTAVISSCGELSQKQSKQVDQALKDSLTSTTETWGVDMKIMEDGIKKIRLRGSYAATYTKDNQNETHIDGPVKIQVFDTTGAIKTHVFSDRAIYQAEKAIFEFYGNVKVNTDNGRHLESEYLKWQQDDNKISTPKFVIVTTPTDSIAGTGYESNSDLTNYTIKEPKGRVIVN